MEHRVIASTDIRPGDLLCGAMEYLWGSVWMVISVQVDRASGKVMTFLMCLGPVNHAAHGEDPFEHWWVSTDEEVFVV